MKKKTVYFLLNKDGYFSDAYWRKRIALERKKYFDSKFPEMGKHRIVAFVQEDDFQDRIRRLRGALQKVVDLGIGPLKVSDSLDIMNEMFDVAGAALVTDKQSQSPSGHSKDGL